MDTIPTNHGPLTAEQIGDRLMYSSYCAQRERGIDSERLRRFYDVERFEPRYRQEQCERCGGTGLVTLFGVDVGGGFIGDADDQPCPECRDDAAPVWPEGL